MTNEQYKKLSMAHDIIERALDSRTGDYWNDAAAGVYNINVLRAIMEFNSITYSYNKCFEDEIYFLTKAGYVGVGCDARTGIPFSNIVHQPYGTNIIWQYGKRDRLRKDDFGNEIIGDLIRDLIAK